MNLTQQSLEELIQRHGLKMTPQRRAVVECLEETQRHPTAEEIHAVVNRRFPMASLATVYNTLHLLKGAGLVQEVFENGVSRFDPNLTQHHHFICRVCGTMEDIADDCFTPPEFSQFQQTVESMEVTLRGLCVTCTNSGA